MLLKPFFWQILRSVFLSGRAEKLFFFFGKVNFQKKHLFGGGKMAGVEGFV